MKNPTPEHHMECAGKNLTGASLYLDLSYGDFSGANMTGAHLTIDHPPQIPDAKFFRTNFSRANLSGAILDEADLQETNLTGAQLRAARLQGAVLTSSTLSGVSSGGIQGVPRALPPEWNLRGGYLVGPGADLAHANLTGLDLSGATLRGVKSGDVSGSPSALPPGWRIVNGYLAGPRADLKDARFRGSNLAGVSLQGAELTGADFEGADLRGVDLANAIWGSGTVCPDGTKTGPSVVTCDDHLGRWSYIAVNFGWTKGSLGNCNERFGVDGTQTCDGEFADLPGPDPNIGYWPFTSDKGGTVIVDKVAGSDNLRIRFFTSPNSAIEGEAESERSDAYGVGAVIIDGASGHIMSPSGGGSGPVGTKGGPLHLDVVGGCSAVCKYDFDIRGWVWVK